MYNVVKSNRIGTLHEFEAASTAVHKEVTAKQHFL